jgi:hypothetical protein
MQSQPVSPSFTVISSTGEAYELNASFLSKLLKSFNTSLLAVHL